MPKTTNIDDVIELLHEEGYMGWTHFRIWQQIVGYLDNHQKIGKYAPIFFSSTIFAHSGMAVLHLTRLLDQHKDAISLEHLLKLAEEQKDHFAHATTEQVVEQVQKDRVILEDLCNRAKDIRAMRDKILAHLDKDRLRDPERIIARIKNINPQDIEDLYQTLSKIVNTYEGFLRDSETLWEVVGWESDLEMLGQLWELGDKEQEAQRECERRGLSKRED